MLHSQKINRSSCRAVQLHSLHRVQRDDHRLHLSGHRPLGLARRRMVKTQRVSRLCRKCNCPSHRRFDFITFVNHIQLVNRLSFICNSNLCPGGLCPHGSTDRKVRQAREDCANAWTLCPSLCSWRVYPDLRIFCMQRYKTGEATTFSLPLNYYVEKKSGFFSGSFTKNEKIS